jgi:DnaA-homolog protein
MTEQLVLELAAPEPPSFDNFIAGANREAVATLRRLAGGECAETGVLLWGAAGTGKTHLLRATVAAASELGRPALVLSARADDAMAVIAGAVDALVAVDDVDALDADAQAHLFTLFNVLRAHGGHLLAASEGPPARLALREDLRTRLGWGLVYELVSLDDDEKPAALAHYAHARGFTLGDDVIRYLLAHGRRDMATLVATLAALDRHSLATKRPITVPLLRGWLQRDISP